MVRHILADGREVDSIEGFVIPNTGRTAAVYHIVAEISRKYLRENNNKKERREANA